MNFASVISTAVFAMTLVSPFAASAQSEADVQYASFVLLCEARYEAKGPTELAVFWREQRGDLTSGELAAGQRTMGSITDALSKINDDIVVTRCKELKSAIDDPDGFVDERSPGLIASADRMPAHVEEVASELRKSGFSPDYMSDLMSLVVSFSNDAASDLARSKLVEAYLRGVIHGLAEQRKAIGKIRDSKKKSKALLSLGSWCPKVVIKDLPKLVKTTADAGDYEKAVSIAIQSTLLDGLEVYLQREGAVDEALPKVKALAERRTALAKKENLSAEEAVVLNTSSSLVVTSCIGGGGLGKTLERAVYDPAEKAEALAKKEIAGYAKEEVSN